MDNYRKGYTKFLKRLNEGEVDLATMRANPQLATNMVITCSDSRVDPNQIFQVPAGSLFTYRNVAGIVPVYGQDASIAAALEFACSQLALDNVIILGHSQCAGAAAMNQTADLATVPDLQQWLDNFTQMPADNYLATPSTEERALLRSLVNCHSYPYLEARIQAGRTKVQVLHFNLQNGSLRIYDHQADNFIAFTD